MNGTSGFIWVDIEGDGDYSLPQTWAIPKTSKDAGDKAALDSVISKLIPALRELLKYPVRKAEAVQDSDGICLFLKNFNEESMKIFLEKGCDQTVLDALMCSAVKEISDFIRGMGSSLLAKKLDAIEIEKCKSASQEIWGHNILPAAVDLLTYLVNSDGYISDMEGGMEKVIRYGPYDKAKFVKAECAECGGEEVGGVWFGKTTGSAHGVVELDLGTGNIIIGDTREVVGNVNELSGVLEFLSEITQRDEEELLCSTVCEHCGTCVAKFITTDGVEVLSTDKKALLHLILNGFIEWGDECLVKCGVTASVGEEKT